VFEEPGFSFARQKGSHVILQHLDGRSIVIPDQQGKNPEEGCYERSSGRQATP